MYNMCVCVCVCVCENYGVVSYTVKINGSCLCTNVVTQFYIKFHCKSFRNWWIMIRIQLAIYNKR